MGSEEVPDTGPVAAIYHRALPHVYGYLLSRCGDVSLAEDLAAETFMAAVAAAGRRPRGTVRITVAWLVGVARHKLADHWRRSVREERSHAAAAAGGSAGGRAALDDPWDEWLDTEAAYAALRCLPAPQRAALTLRYLDGLPVAEVAAHLGRSVHATETLLARSRAALRAVYRACDRRGAMAADPLDALRLPVVPVDPRQEFTAALLRRIRSGAAGAAGQPQAGARARVITRPSATSSATSTPRSSSTASVSASRRNCVPRRRSPCSTAAASGCC